ncbi:hypothetical protein I5M99_17255 [Serratia marcescens]|nr:hypothetical protein [Serratia marcescens]
MENKHTTAEDFDDSSFWNKIMRYAKKAGSEVIEKALWLYFAAQRPNTPLWAKTAIYGALAYFVLPMMSCLWWDTRTIWVYSLPL